MAMCLGCSACDGVWRFCDLVLARGELCWSVPIRVGQRWSVLVFVDLYYSVLICGGLGLSMLVDFGER